MPLLDAKTSNNRDSGGASFSLSNRLTRLLWLICWKLLAAWTPPPFHSWRCFLLRAFGAKIGQGVRLYGSISVWLPSNLTIGDRAIVGPRVKLYNQGAIDIGDRAVISQDAHLCASTHDVNDYYFQLVLRPIRIETNAWIAAEAFVGPGVTVSEGAVLAARGVAVFDLKAWGVYGGNPAKFLKERTFINA